MQPTKKAARIAGLLYLVVVITGPFVLLYVPGKLFVSGDASASAANILAHQTLFRTYILVGLVGQLFFLASILAFYRLLKGVSAGLAAIMALVILLPAPLSFLSNANQLATLSFLRNPGFLSAFDKSQRDALVMLLIDFDQQGVYISEMFWGLWLFPLGVLVYRSGFLPRFLGVWLFINGLAYVVISTTGILAPQHARQVSNISTPVLFGEAALMLWLLIMGVREKRPETRGAPA